MISTLPAYLDHYAQLTPDADAIWFLQQRLTYQQLSEQSAQLAQYLLRLDVARNDRIGLYLDKSLQLPVALYGIMKAGAAYVPLDVTAPAERTAAIINDCGIKVIVTADNKARALQKVLAAMEPKDSASIHLIGVSQFSFADRIQPQTSWQEIYESQVIKNPMTRVLESDLAYIIYTSGSTGVPKGIMHTHHSAISFARWAAAEYQLCATDRVSNPSALHFDMSIFDYFATLVVGASTAIIPEDYSKLPASFSTLLSENKVTVLFTVPFSLIQLTLHGALEQRDLSALRWVIFGGEPFATKYLRQLMQKLPNARFDNMYGPAEINGCTHHTVENLGDEHKTIPIGKMATFADFMVVDADSQPVETGRVGELWVRTPTMMQGYLGQSELTQRVFYRQAVVSGYERRFFKTGDLVKCGDDGTLWFIGRKDRQVKVRGYRVELDEVEAMLAAHPDVEEAAVFARPQPDNKTEITAACILNKDLGGSQPELYRYVKSRLPIYAVPHSIHIFDSFPRTTSGKIDRNALKDLTPNDR